MSSNLNHCAAGHNYKSYPKSLQDAEKGTSMKQLKSFHSRPILFTLSIIFLVFAAYGLSLGNGFVWDDIELIVNNPYVNDFSKWPLYIYFSLAETVSNDSILSHMYRPIQTLSFGFDATLWDNWAGGFHLMSILLHIGTCFAMVFAFSSLVGPRRRRRTDRMVGRRRQDRDRSGPRGFRTSVHHLPSDVVHGVDRDLDGGPPAALPAGHDRADPVDCR